MKYRLILATLFAIASSFTAQGQMITGSVISVSATPIGDASVSLRVKGASATTDSSGEFALDLSSQILPHGLNPAIHSVLRFNGKGLAFTTASEENMRIDLHTINGKVIRTVVDKRYGPGNHLIPISMFIKNSTAQGLFIAAIQKGNERYNLAFASVGEQCVLIGGNWGSAAALAYRSFAKGAVLEANAVDVLIVSKQSYVPKTLDITTYTTQDVGDIVLRTIVEDSTAIERKVDSLLALMSNTQKAGQMVQVMNTAVTPSEVTNYGFGSIFNGGEEPVLPNTPQNWANRLDALQDGALAAELKIPMIYGLDAVHGNGKVVRSTIFPHNIGLGCTGDTALVEQVGRVTAIECAAVGVHLTFAPCISVVRDERWGRTYEGFGETPEINSRMGAALLRGLQGDGDLSKTSAIAACAKHYLGDGGTADGVNGGITTLTEATMSAVHYPPYVACAREKMASVMPSYNAWSRSGQTIKQTIDSISLTHMLKHDLNWDGFILTDYDAIPQAFTSGGYSAQNVGTAVMAGCDMAMIPKKTDALQFIQSIQDAINGGFLTQARLDDAVSRILRIKFRMDLWGHPKSQPDLMTRIGCDDHRAIAREAVRKSLVLLKNEDAALPLQRTERVAVVGPWANSMGAQCGGWTIGWQGSIDYTTVSVGGGRTILLGIQELGGSNVTWDEQGSNLSSVDKIVLVLGEHPYAEGQGDSTNPALSRLPHASLLDKCASSGKPVICILISGRPMLISDKLSLCKAFVAAWLPGTEGIGVADVLYGDYNFSGTLTHTWPNSLDQIPINSGPSYTDEPTGSGGNPLFAYGFGLTY